MTVFIIGEDCADTEISDTARWICRICSADSGCTGIVTKTRGAANDAAHGEEEESDEEACIRTWVDDYIASQNAKEGPTEEGLS